MGKKPPRCRHGCCRKTMENRPVGVLPAGRSSDHSLIGANVQVF
ncbi:hypothetical protein [Paraburkholderia jirisanensis]|jgi:hypothetical protein